MIIGLLLLCRYGFYISILLFLYGTLFPFDFDFSNFPSSQFGLTPFWDTERGRIHSLPDMLSNGLLTAPLGFFGFLWFGRQSKSRSIAIWFIVGFLLGVTSEIVQLAIPSRVSGITDALNNGLGAFAGAVFASLFGRRILDLLSGSLLDGKHTWFVILVGVATAGTLLPLDFSIDVAHLRSCLKQLWLNPWETGKPVQDEWIVAAVLSMIGATAGLMARARLVLFSLLLPIILESLQILVESHAPSLRDLAMGFGGAVLGLVSARISPHIVRPATGFILMNVALLAQGLSPYRYGGHMHFEWIPLVEYYNQTTGAALYDALAGIFSYGLLAALWPRKTTILWAVLLSGVIEVAQMFLATRYGGITDIVIAGIAAWVGYTVSKRATDCTDDRLHRFQVHHKW